ncbi:MAG: DNA gyrase modulator, partial [Verrucomicrobiota bacterium]
MHRRDWLKGTSAAGIGLLTSRWIPSTEAADAISAKFPSLSAAALSHAQNLGASFADFHIMQTDSESLFVREEMVQGVDANSNLGCSIRVLVEGAWGFAATQNLSEAAIRKTTESAIALAKGQVGWRAQPVAIETLPAYEGSWHMPFETDPFTVSLEEKVEGLLDINRSALGTGANFCYSYLLSVRERK